jgi:mono/diheme cytochrome c family protein
MKISKRVGIPVALLALSLPYGLAQAAEDGKALYGSKCAMCHGNAGVAGKMGAGARNFNDPAFKKSVTADDIVKIAHDGKGKMKGLGDKLSADQAKAVADYILTLAK